MSEGEEQAILSRYCQNPCQCLFALSYEVGEFIQEQVMLVPIC